MVKKYEIICPICGNVRMKTRQGCWAIEKGKTTTRCFKCTRLKKGETNSGSFRKGIKVSKKTQFKKGLIPWNKGVGRPEMRGNKNPMWKGGTTLLKTRVRDCFKYFQWRSDIFTRDDFICQECERRGVYLEAHHIKLLSKIIEEYEIKTLEEALICEELWNINNGMTLCRECHDKTKGYNKKK